MNYYKYTRLNRLKYQRVITKSKKNSSGTNNNVKIKSIEGRTFRLLTNLHQQI